MKHHILMLPAVAVLAAACLPCMQAARAQTDSNFHLEMNANSNTTAHDLGLPAFPGSLIYRKPHDSGEGSFGFSIGNTQFQLKMVTYEAHASNAEVIAFYHHALRHYGQVLECVNGKPIGKRTTTPSGLTCSDDSATGSKQVTYDSSSGSDSGIELRAGAPHRYRIAAVENDGGDPGMTKFALVYLEIPKDDSGTPD